MKNLIKLSSKTVIGERRFFRAQKENGLNEIIRMTPEQASKVKKVVKKQCCNAIDGNCILLEGQDPCPCPQLITHSLICRWFLSAVLPGERELEQELIKKASENAARYAAAPTTPPPIGANTARTAPRK